MRALLGLLVLAAVCGADPVADAATAVHEAFRAGKSLEELAAKDKPDPWLVADELCARGEYGAAEAFARTAPRPDTAKLPGYVAAQRATPTDPAMRKTLVAARRAVAKGDAKGVLAATDDVSPGAGVTRVRLLYYRGTALRELGSLEASDALYEVVDAAERLGWIARLASALDQAGFVLWRHNQRQEALEAWTWRLSIEETRGNRAGLAAALRNVGYAHGQLFDPEGALELHRRALEIYEELHDGVGVIATLGNIAAAHAVRGDQARQLEFLERETGQREAGGDVSGAADTLAKIGKLRFSRGEHAAALRCIERALALNEGLDSPRRTVISLNSLAMAHLNLGNYAKAIECQERCLALSRPMGDRSVAYWLLSIGQSHYRAGDYNRALRACEEARGLKEKLRDAAGVAGALAWIGHLHYRLDDYAAALEAYRKQLELYEQMEKRGQAAATRGAISSIQTILGDLTEARVSAEHTFRELDEIGDRRGVAWALVRIGNAAYLMGDYAESLASYEHALSLFEGAKNRRGVATASLNIGNVYNEIGDYSRALQRYRSALKRVGPGESADLAYCLSAIASAKSRLGKTREARELYEKALAELATTVGSKVLVGRILNNLGHVHQKTGDYSAALASHREALELAEDLGARPLVADVLISTSGARRRLRDYVNAAKLAERGLAIAREIRNARSETWALTELAATHLAAGRPDRSLEAARLAVARVSIPVQGLADEQGAAARERFRAIFETGVAAGRLLDDAAEVSFFLESGRAGALLEGMALRERLGAFTVPEELRGAELIARDRERVAVRHYRRALDQGADAAALWKRVEAARARIVAVVQRIRREAKAQAGLLYPTADSLNEIQSALREREAMLLYALLEKESVALVVTTQDARIIDLGETQEIVKAAEALQRAVVRPDERGLQAPPHERSPFLVKRLRKLVIEPLGLADKTTRLLVSPDGLLAYAPFAALAPDVEVAYVPSGTTYRLLLEDAGQRGAKVLALGDPDYTGKLDTTTLTILRRGEGLSPLPATREEARAVGDVTLLGKEATLTGFRKALGTQKRWRAVHFACHGLVDPERPVLSSLALTPDGGADGFLRCLDVYRMRIPADLVVLSACETGKGKIYKAEGVIGWTRAFLFAGAPRVIVSLWKVDDKATQALMVKFYALWKNEKLPAASALKRAQDHVRSRAEWRHPYFWAAWQLWGLAE